MKTTRSLSIIICLFILSTINMHAQMTWNFIPVDTKNSRAILLTTGKRSDKPQKIAIPSVDSALPLTSSVKGLLVYSSIPPKGGSGIGYYYWNGTTWVRPLAVILK